MKAWEGTLKIPVAGRSQKPRSTGFTMIIDKGLGIEATKDLIRLAGGYIDDIKLTFGTSAFYDEELLREKNALITEAGIDVMPGGTFLEVAIWQKVYDRYLKRAKELGFSMIEVSDGTIDIDSEIRATAIKKAIDIGFKVMTEVGKKDPNEKIAMSLMHEEIAADMNHGAFKVIVEAREAGKGVGIYDKEGKIKNEEIEAIVSGVDNPDVLVWEAPIKNQQQELILRFGVNVNLGNIPPAEILALESLRQGLRGDTLKRAYRAGTSA